MGLCAGLALVLMVLSSILLFAHTFNFSANVFANHTTRILWFQAQGAIRFHLSTAPKSDSLIIQCPCFFLFYSRGLTGQNNLQNWCHLHHKSPRWYLSEIILQYLIAEYPTYISPSLLKKGYFKWMRLDKLLLIYDNLSGLWVQLFQIVWI